MAAGGTTRSEDVAEDVDAELSLAVVETITVRVAEPVRPCGSVTTYLIVCVPAVVVSMVTVPTVDVALSTSTVMPRLVSAAGPVIVAPRSA